MPAPALSSLSGDGFRFYRWEDRATGREIDVLSVTTIRTLCGQPINLVSWQLANLADAALGTMKRVVVGPRGGISEKRLVEEYPCEFAQRYDAAAGDQKEIDALRQWLRAQADAPRNIAAVRGTIVHEAIELGVEWRDIDERYVLDAFTRLSNRDKKSMAERGLDPEDVAFVRHANRHYWHMRENVPFIILAREVQVFNLEAGYAGTFDALTWFLGTFDDDGVFTPLDIDRSQLPRARDVTLEDVKRIGGTLVLVDWKTSADVHTDQVVQAVAYLSAEFVAAGPGLRDHRLTELLRAASIGGLAHIRPDGWGLYVFKWEPEIARAFLGSVALARFLAKYRDPKALFFSTFKGQSEEDDD